MPNKAIVLLLRLLRPLLHASVISVLFWGAYWLRLRTDLIPGMQIRIPPIVVGDLVLFGGCAIVIFVALGLYSGLYQLRGVLRYRNLFMKTRSQRFVVIIFVAYLGSDFVFSGGISRWIILLVGVSSFFVLSLCDMIRNSWISYVSSAHPVRVLCVYWKDSQQDLIATAFTRPQYRLTRLPASQRHGHEDYASYDVIVMVGDYADEQLQEAFDHIRLGHQEFYHIPTSGFLDDMVYEPTVVGSLHAFRLSPTRLDDRSAVFKRLFDVVGSMVGIVGLLPLILLIAAIIMIDSRGPALYRQQRVGRQGKLFTFLKFRSMYTHLSTGEAYGGAMAAKIESDLDASSANDRDAVLSKIDNDPRVTRVGRFIRRTSLDELPQLFCVLRGTMSLVGPRPHLPREVAKYQSWHTRLFAIKPGITGYAQIFGRDSLTFDEEARLDLEYIQNRSLWLDVYAIIKTVGVVCKGR